MKKKNIPADITVDLKKSQVTIKWLDDQVKVYTLDMLRKNCPCAVCVDLRKQAQENPLRVLTTDQASAKGELDPERPVEIVGQYALQFFWIDGHRSGIYSYDLLRKLN